MKAIMINRVSVVLATIIFFTFVLIAKYMPLDRPITNSSLIKIVEVNKQEHPLMKAKKKERLINIIVTYYTNSIGDCQSTAGIAASGKNLVSASRGGDIKYVAAPKNIPFNTKVNVKGIGICDVQDRGGAIKHVWIDNVEYMKLDIFVKGATRQQLLNKGLLKTTGYIIE
jgi:3D (Asp-Asp-Asp) domain-containing protein